MDDTYLVPLDFGTASSTRSGTSSSSVVLKELTEVIHERCSRSADDYVVELTDGTMRERPRVPQQRWISKEVSRRAPSVVTVLEDDEIRGVVLDYMQSRETRFKVTAIIDDLEELTADAGSQVEARRDALEQEAQQLAKEDEEILVQLRKSHLTTFGALVRIEPDHDEPNWRRIHWHSRVLGGDWTRRSPVVVAARIATEGRRGLEEVDDPVLDLAARIIDANPDVVARYKNQRSAQMDRIKRDNEAHDRKESEYIMRWLNIDSDGLEAYRSDSKARSRLLKAAKRREAQHEADIRSREAVEERERTLTAEERAWRDRERERIRDRVGAVLGR